MIGLTLPPPYRVIRLAPERSAFTDTWAAAKAGEEQGVIFWTERTDRLDFALTLKPDRPRRAAMPVVYVAAFTFADALGAFVLPPSPIGFGWPRDILVDGGVVGGLSLALASSAADAVPEWAVLGFDLAVNAESKAGRYDERVRAATSDCTLDRRPRYRSSEGRS